MVSVDLPSPQAVQHIWLPQVRKKSGKKSFLQGQGKVRDFQNLDTESGNFEKSQGKVTIVRGNLDFMSKIIGEHQFSVISVQFLFCLFESY